MTITHATASCLVARTKASLNHHDQINFLSWTINTKFSQNPSINFGAETFKRKRTPSHYTFVLLNFYKGTEKRDAVAQPKPYRTQAAINCDTIIWVRMRQISWECIINVSSCCVCRLHMFFSVYNETISMFPHEFPV
jgi:hypothetical protein